MAFPILETKRLKLIELKHHHMNVVYEILSLEDVTRYYGTSPFTLPAEATRLIDIFHKNYLDKRGIRWGIKLKENQRLIGTVGLNVLNLKNKRAEIGYELHPSVWGNGFAEESVSEVIRFSFQKLDLHRIGAVVYPENTASLALLDKLGFTNEGLLRGYMYQDEQYHDSFMLSILKTEWEKSQDV
ncbi:GNAT family N-acetyltransferase [Bacillus sp. USDA818B3_A]|uniref:GNAT family N-acetyltransferase n=1 Tax=Bacillus sp. USDA818B3_A TaxID=2698834 RepID=UPI00136E5801|nr:GNAT family N-acetyltransferase [Bacillus sp. USDA818B3_A]